MRDKIYKNSIGYRKKVACIYGEIFIYALGVGCLIQSGGAHDNYDLEMHLKLYSLSFTNNRASASAPMRFSSLSTLGGCWNLFRKLEIMVAQRAFSNFKSSLTVEIYALLWKIIEQNYVKICGVIVCDTDKMRERLSMKEKEFKQVKIF